MKQGGNKRPYGGGPNNERSNQGRPSYGKPSGERQGGYQGKPSYGKPSGERQGSYQGKPSYGKPSGERQGGYQGKPSYGKPSGEGQGGYQGKPSYGKPSGERQGGYQGKPSYSKPSGERQGGYQGKPSYGKPSGEGQGGYQGRPSYGKPSGERQGGYQGKPSYGKPSYGKPAFDRSNERSGERGQERPAPRPRPTYAPPERAPIAPQAEASPPPENILAGRNPIREALRAGRHFEALYVQKGELNGSAREIVKQAREQRVIIKEVDRRALDNMSPGHQGLVGLVSAYQYHTIQDMLALAKERGQEPLIVVLDGITDPHNFGAIARTAECCGAHGVIVCERRAVGMTPGAARASAGAFEHIPVARVSNISRLIGELKAAGLWVYAADQAGQGAHYRADLKGPAALVIGDEGEGISRLALEKCDSRLAIPIRGKIESLNASVAAGVLLYEIVRQRDALQ